MHGRIDPRIYGRFNAEPRRLHIEPVAENSIALVHINRRSGEAAQLLRAADMIDMGMRDDDHLRFQSVTFENPHDIRNVIARIDDDGLTAGFIADYRTVASQHSHRQNFVNHLISCFGPNR